MDETVRSHNYCNQSEITVRNVIQLYVAVKTTYLFLCQLIILFQQDSKTLAIRGAENNFKVQDTVTAFSLWKVNCTPRLRGCENCFQVEKSANVLHR